MGTIIIVQLCILIFLGFRIREQLFMLSQTVQKLLMEDPDNNPIFNQLFSIYQQLRNVSEQIFFVEQHFGKFKEDNKNEEI